jgi:hypothetical protein
LVSPTYVGHNAIWIKPPGQNVDVNTTIKASFGRDINEYEFESALIYKLQRKKRLESNDQSNEDDTSIEDTSTSIQLLVMWGSDNWHSLHIRALLIKHSSTVTWNEDTLEKLHSMHLALLNKVPPIDISGMPRVDYSIEDNSFIEEDRLIVEDTWLLDDAKVLMTTSKWKQNSSTFEIVISEGTREDGTMEPLWVSLNM